MACQDNGNEHLKNKINTTLLRGATIYSHLQNKKYVPEGPSNRTAKPKQQTNELRDKPTPNWKATRWLSWYGVGLASADDCWWWFKSLLVHSGVSSATRRKATGADHKKTNPQPEKGEGGSQSGGCVCVVGVDSSQPSLVTSANKREAKPTTKKRRTGRADRNKQHKEAPNKHKKRPSQQGGEPYHKTEQKAARRTKGARGEEGKRRPTEKEREDAREGSRGRRENHTGKEAFFRPTPSWLPPGRSTCFIACCKLGLID